MKNKSFWLTVLIIITLAFIWGNSIFDREQSSDISSFVKNIVEPILELIVGRGNVTEHLVRKLAHFAEFTLLGMELLPAFRMRFNRGIFLLSISHGLFAALVDETIQIFTGRGPAVADIWLDFSGVIFGASLLYFVIKLVTNRKIRYNKI